MNQSRRWRSVCGRAAGLLRAVGGAKEEGGRSVAPIAPVELLEARKLLSTYIVDNIFTGDESDGNFTANDLTLREAVLLADANPGPDTIVFSPLLNGTTIDLTLGEINPTGDLVIRGYSQFDFPLDITINAGGTQRHFGVGSGGSLTIENLTLANGSHASVGGSIHTQGSLTLIDSTIQSSAAGRGGAVFVEATGSLSISGSSFIGNAATATGGGAITALGSFTISNSTLAANTAAGIGGAIEARADGSLTGVTLSGNSAASAGGGIAIASGSVAIMNATFTLNRSDSDASGGETGGAISVSGGAAALVSTLVSGNYRGSGVSTNDDIAGTVTGTFNLVGSASTAGGLTHGVGNNLVGVSPLLGAISLNGGAVQTHPLLEGSPAIDAGSNPGALSNDVRGGRYLRNDGGGVDIGAYERQAFALVVAHLTDENDGDSSDGDLSLREAIAITNENPVADSITFADGLTGTLTLSGTSIKIEDTVTITGPGQDELTIDANGLSRVFWIDDPSGTLSDPVFIEGLTLTGGNGGGGIGGAILSAERLTLFQVTITGNASTLGGGLYSSGQLIIADSIITDNVSAVAGGGLTFEPFLPEQLIIARTTITGNSADGGGGVAVFGSSASATIFDSIISDNTSTFSGGGIAFYNGGTATVTNTTVANNTVTGASQQGGGIAIVSTSLVTIEGSTISGNTGADLGGGIYVAQGSFTLTNSTVSGNESLSKGGGVYIATGTSTIQNSTIAFNTADTNSSVAGVRGGGLFNDAAMVTIVSTIVASNASGGVSIEDIGGTLEAGSTHNLVSGLGSAGGLANGIGSNIVGIGANLGTLAMDLGSVATHPILSGSPAISAGTNASGEDLDQAGQSRSKGLGIDIGAREADLVPVSTVSVPSGSLGGGQSIELGATATDEDGAIAKVQWFHDANNDGVADASELIGTDLDGSDGWQLAYTLPNTVDPVIGLVVLAVAFDDDSNQSPPAAAAPIFINALPTFDPLTTFQQEITRGGTVTILLNNVADADGSIRDVKFYFDANDDGIPDASEFVGIDTTASSGTYGASYKIPLSSPSGPRGFIAVVTDNREDSITTNVAYVEVINIAPTLGRLSLGSSTFSQGDFVSLSATNFSDVDGTGDIASVRFYHDLNLDGIADDSELLATDAEPINGFVIVLTRNQTRALPMGTTRFLAIAVDPEGGESTPKGATGTVLFSLLANENTTIQSSASPGDLHRVLSINQAGDAVSFEQQGSGSWTAIQFTNALGAPAALDDAITWTDPKDALTYAAYPSQLGLILLKRDAAGVWSYRNLTDEIDGAVGPVRNLTQFISAAGTGQVVVIAGIDADDRLVAYQQFTPAEDQTDADISPDDFAYQFVDISASLDDGGFDTPAYTELISYRTAWDAWHLAGLNAEGDIISVWTSPSVFTAWRTDNLSEANGSAPLTGGLTAILTNWRGINLTGLNQQGEVIVTWWIPSFGGTWENANLTESFDGPTISGQGLTGYYTTWNGMNYAGIDENNQIVIYWWVPAFGGEWVTSVITDVADFSIPRPTGQLTSLASGGGTLSILGASANGDVIRASWQASQGGDWLLENLSEDALRA